MSPLDLTVTDIRQHVYCPRIPYYRYTMPLERPVTAKMDLGKEEHETTSAKEARRTLKAYGIEEGERRFGVDLYSEPLRLRGKIDMVILAPREVVPVEYKMAAAIGLHHKYQLAAYALLAEHTFGGTVSRAFVYLTPEKRAVEIPITPAMRAHVKKIVAELRDATDNERLPRPTPHRARCTDCEYRRFCGDVLTGSTGGA
ncbi:MAG: CRISPR-associated protein Cas4 [Rubrobacteraceae bacterium]